MGLYLQSNTSALVAQNYFGQSEMAINSSFAKLSSGYKIISAADDAAGLGIAKSFNAQVQSYGVASQNAQDAVSMVQTADGSADQIDSLLTRMRELAVEGQNGTMSANDLTNLGTEFGQDLSEIDRVAGDATFNTHQLLAGSTNSVNFQVGIQGTSNDQISVQFGGLDTSGLGLTGAAVTSSTILTTIDNAMQTLNNSRAGFGAAMNRLQNASNQITSTQTNLSSALSAIQDVDVATETANLAREQVLAQAGASVLSQANQAPQLAQKLLG